VVLQEGQHIVVEDREQPETLKEQEMEEINPIMLIQNYELVDGATHGQCLNNMHSMNVVMVEKMLGVFGDNLIKTNIK
tara:strand:+ start:106 stop:339 length:234 start_codon:yes stop_codon:yes gene_type:complete